jgi:hypothetical protein
LALWVLLFSGCASIGNTAKQDYVWEMGRVCDTRIFEYKLERVEADGRYWIRGIPNSTGGARRPYFECMTEQFQAHPYLAWLKERQRATQPETSIGAGPIPPSPIESEVIDRPVAAPVWKVGDEWEYAYQDSTGSGTYVWTVARIEQFDGSEHYVVKSGARESLYRVGDLAISGEREDGTIISRDVPARTHYMWPLTVGKVWEQSYRQDRPVARQTFNRSVVWTVESEETVVVPAGTFRSMRITSRNKTSARVGNEIWYAPAVKQWVKSREVLTSGTRERELVSFKLK